VPMRNPAWLGRAALLPLPFAANAARSERESDGSAVGRGDLVTDAACAESGDAAVMRDANNRSCRLSTRTVKRINQDLRVNKAVWVAEKMAAFKTWSKSMRPALDA